jgi:hypothetical protein
MVFLFLLAILISSLTGFLVICCCWPNDRFACSNLLFKICLAVGLGVGISSCSFFLELSVSATSRASLIITEASLLACLIAVYLYVNRRRDRALLPELPTKLISDKRITLLLAVVFSLALVSALITFVSLLRQSPHGQWDAWAIWNLRARFMYRGGERWVDAFSNLLAWSRPDYPLLVPGFVARCWGYLGNETWMVPAFVALVFTFATIGVTSLSLALLRSKSQGLLAGVTLLSTPFLIRQGASQYADVPLGFFYLATISLICLQDRLPENKYRLLLLAGMMAGFAGWTKNEGLMFLGAVLAARFAVIVPVRGWKIYLRQMLFFAIGLAPILIIIVYFKLRFPPPNYLVDQGYKPLIERLMSPARYTQTFQAFAHQIVNFGEWVFYPVPLLAGYLCCVGVDKEAKNRSGFLTSLVIVSLTLAGYFLVYIITPYDLGWQLSNSLSRLIVQLWPTMIFAFFLVAATPEQALIGSSRSATVQEQRVQKMPNILPALFSSETASKFMVRTLFIVPAYNEEENLTAVISDLRAHYPDVDIVVVNDGSTDGTAASARSLGVILLDLPYNLGIGGTVQTGLLFANQEGYDIAIQFDGDGQHQADQVGKLLEAFRDRSCDVVIGSRFLGSSVYRPPLMRRLGITIFQLVNSLVLGRKITDNTSGFRAYSRAAIAFLARNYPHDYPEPESIVTLCRNGFEVVEVPVSMRERQGGRSSITFWRSIYYMCKVLIAIIVGATRRTVRRPLDELADTNYSDCR